MNPSDIYKESLPYLSALDKCKQKLSYINLELERFDEVTLKWQSGLQAVEKDIATVNEERKQSELSSSILD